MVSPILLDPLNMKDLDIPNFGELLAPYLNDVPSDALPFLLSQLERTAADRYRGWAEQVPAERQGLLECAASEDEIADRVEALLPPTEEHRQRVLSILPSAKDTYYQVFEGHTAVEQMTIQANAERQGASAWQGLKNAYPQHAAAMDELSAIELKSADCVSAIVARLN